MIVLTNHADAADVAQSPLHEGVGHHGLSKLAGDTDFDLVLESDWWIWR